MSKVDYLKIVSFILIVMILSILFLNLYEDSKYIRTQIGDINKDAYLFTQTLRQDFKYVIVTNINTNESLILKNGNQ